MMRSEESFNQSIAVLQGRLKYDINLLEERLKKDKNAVEKCMYIINIHNI